MVPNFVQDQLNRWDALLLFQGLVNTVRLCALGLAVGLLIALVLGLARPAGRVRLVPPAARLAVAPGRRLHRSDPRLAAPDAALRHLLRPAHPAEDRDSRLLGRRG